MKRVLPVLLILSMLLAACGKDTQETTSAPTETSAAPATEATVPVTTVPAPTEAAKQAAGKPSPLTGVPTQEPLNKRPYAVVINNIVNAMPQCGVRDADIVYEVLAEGGITRCLAIFHDPAATGPIGSIRSSRPYLADLSMAYDAVFVHAGGSEAGYQKISDYDIDHLDGVRGPSANKYYYRDQNRLSNGYDLEHTLFLTGEKMLAYAQDREIELTREKDLDYGLKFADEALPSGAEAKTVKVTFGGGGKETNFVYQKDTGLYTASQYGKDYVDGSTGAKMDFRNLIVITAETSYDSRGYRLEIDLTDSGDGWFMCDGKMVPIHWSREDAHEPFVYTLRDGTPLTLGTGRTYIAVVPTGSEVVCE